MVVKFLFKLIRATLFEWRLKRAQKKAQKDANLYRRKFLVMVMDGKPVVVSMQGIKDLIRRRRLQRDLRPKKPAK